MSDQPSSCQFNTRDLILRVDLTIVGDVKAIDPAVKQIMSVVTDMGCGSGNEFEIETAVREALANAIVHGCCEDRHQTVSISVSCDESRGMIIVVRDPGVGFDPEKLPNPVVGERVFEDHGRGIYLINQLMDEVRFRAGGTEIWMRKA
jgi:serine/threonine-protein kinase RsbW